MDPCYLRFMVHLILLCRAVGFSVDQAASNRLISAYVDLLIEADKRELVPLYAAHLSHHLQVDKMAQLFQSWLWS